MIRRNIGKAFDSLQKISHIAENIFHILRRGICHIREDAKCCNIYKMTVVEGTHITQEIFSGHCQTGGFHHIPRNLQTSGKIIDSS